MVDQLAGGLQLFEVLPAIKKHKEEMHKLFICDGEEEISADVLLNMMMLDFSLNEQLKYQEIRTYKSFCDFVQMLECKGMYNLLLLLLIKQLFCNNYGFHKVPTPGYITSAFSNV